MADSAPKAMSYELVVIHPFADYKRGDVISDAKEIASMSEESLCYVIKRAK
ncbi:hypothetical protein [Serratia marcescens]|uniref:hypothetical protein n=1 Tax=Serratia marcescens TaxID=615 RepID=UPI0034E88E51